MGRFGFQVRADDAQLGPKRGCDGQFERRFGENHIIGAGIDIEVDLETRIKLRRGIAGQRIMAGAELIGIIEQCNFLLGGVGEPDDCLARAKPEVRGDVFKGLRAGAFGMGIGCLNNHDRICIEFLEHIPKRIELLAARNVKARRPFIIELERADVVK
jgi:hypothetical protein